jgi:hypothetical protein
MRNDCPCGNPNCSVSSSFNDELTFGSGELDDYGFWEKPCKPCARAFEKAHPDRGACWPFHDSDIEAMTARTKASPRPPLRW